MKKFLVITVIITGMFAGSLFAGEIANKLGEDMLVGSLISSMVGVAFSAPSYINGGNTANPEVFGAGACWGALIGAGLGLLYGTYDVYEYIDDKNTMQKKNKKSAFLEPDILFSFNNGMMILSKNF